MKNKKLILFLTFVLTFAFVLTGCKTTTPQKPNLNNRTQTNIRGYTGTRRNVNRIGTNLDMNKTNNRIGTNLDMNKTNNNIVRNNITTRTTSDRAETIARKVANLREVNKATAVIHGNTCLVGVDLKNVTDGRVNTALRSKVDRICKDNDPAITKVQITTDPTLYSRISTMARDIRSGKPVTGFTNEIRDILRRITPGM